MKKILVFNWKMNPNSLKEAEKISGLIADDLKLKTKNLEIAVAPPFVYLQNLKFKIKSLKLGAQDVFWENPPVGGAYTGEISANMLKDFGVEFVIVGHSERRNFLNETDGMVNKKILTVLKSGLKAILCVGENLAVRRRGKKAVESFIGNQLEENLKNVGNFKRLIVAYEPVWAIGTGHSDTPDDAVEMAEFIKKIMREKRRTGVKVIYGGSVNGKNVEKFAEREKIDGFLIGGAGLKRKEFDKIIKIVYNSI